MPNLKTIFFFGPKGRLRFLGHEKYVGQGARIFTELFSGFYDSESAGQFVRGMKVRQELACDPVEDWA